ncbi:IQ domain-containing protein C [Pseudoliparis swirei]|uniref:IQ domain-containing protein C n=1 Tax=Pseudoliparis swirei TaxID=2059687 RepID=UPI0024BDE4F1|nr:IQ domain-containing protein C [Pseudoliparis swirei]
MERSKRENILTCFQASARGYLVRNEVRRARGDFEDIVKEIDGGLTHLEWRETAVPVPRFTDTDGPLLRPGSSACKPSNARRVVCASPQRSAPSAPSAASSSAPSAPSSSSAPPPSSAPSAAPLSEETGDQCVLPEKMEAERDDSQTKGRASLSQHGVQKGSAEVEKDGDSSSTTWSSLELDVNYGHSHKAAGPSSVAPEGPCAPEALRLHRNALTMELVWLQQAIGSRKQYLSLKDRLSVS